MWFHLISLRYREYPMRRPAHFSTQLEQTPMTLRQEQPRCQSCTGQALWRPRRATPELFKSWSALRRNPPVRGPQGSSGTARYPAVEIQPGLRVFSQKWECSAREFLNRMGRESEGAFRQLIGWHGLVGHWDSVLVTPQPPAWRNRRACPGVPAPRDGGPFAPFRPWHPQSWSVREDPSGSHGLP